MGECLGEQISMSITSWGPPPHLLVVPYGISAQQGPSHNLQNPAGSVRGQSCTVLCAAQWFWFWKPPAQLLVIGCPPGVHCVKGNRTSNCIILSDNGLEGWMACIPLTQPLLPPSHSASVSSPRADPRPMKRQNVEMAESLFSAGWERAHIMAPSVLLDLLPHPLLKKNIPLFDSSE